MDTRHLDARHHQTALLLTELQTALQTAGLWRSVAPAPEALASSEPFCVDTLDFGEWLQFVFLPRMRALLDSGAPLPARCAIAEMAETVWTGNANAVTVITQLRLIDRHIEQRSQMS